jgi:arsenite methyltransferase
VSCLWPSSYFRRFGIGPGASRGEGIGRQMRNGCLHPGGQRMTERLLQLAPLPSGARILEIGCGSGQTVLYLQNLGYDATGIDKEAAWDNPHIQNGDMLHLTFPQGSFDAVIAECSLSASGDASAALENAYQILKPGGQLFASDVFFPETDGKQAELWVGMIQQAGFDVIQMEDASAEVQAFFLQMIWEQGCLPEHWKRIAAGRKKVGYFLICGRKSHDG